VLDTPRQFLPADTTFCPGGNMLLQPNATFTNYKWNTGATDAFITVTQPGSYTLTVTDNNGCKGIDATVVALKDCATWVYIPTGFTPDNNGRNDVFRPLVSGTLASYYFAVYNRWGQCIFASADPQKGWDGTFKNTRQPTGTYTWLCRYRFEGGKDKNEKGTVVLVR
jgi:gliding motility-associated-like protein